MKRGILDRHPGMNRHPVCLLPTMLTHPTHTKDEIFEEMWSSIGRPPVMFVDLRPVSLPLLLVSDHEIAEQISKPSKLFPLSTPKSPTWTHMLPIIGSESILGREVSIYLVH